jgi:hypothetical protein
MGKGEKAKSSLLKRKAGSLESGKNSQVRTSESTSSLGEIVHRAAKATTGFAQALATTYAEWGQVVTEGELKSALAWAAKVILGVSGLRANVFLGLREKTITHLGLHILLMCSLMVVTLKMLCQLPWRNLRRLCQRRGYDGPFVSCGPDEAEASS